jgi:adenylyl-sulfate kinase
MTGLSGAGKTTLAVALEHELHRKGYFTKSFDGDEIRKGLNKDLGFSIEDRIENIRRTAEVARLFCDHGLIVICSLITPTEEMRTIARETVGRDRFVEIFVNCPLEVCEKRDVKGLYQKARAGLIKNFTGIDATYERPENPDIELRTDLWDVKKTARYLFRHVYPLIRYRKKKWLSII